MVLSRHNFEDISQVTNLWLPLFCSSGTKNLLYSFLASLLSDRIFTISHTIIPCTSRLSRLALYFQLSYVLFECATVWPPLCSFWFYVSQHLESVIMSCLKFKRCSAIIFQVLCSVICSLLCLDDNSTYVELVDLQFSIFLYLNFSSSGICNG